jgi:hypothetical protein
VVTCLGLPSGKTHLFAKKLNQLILDLFVHQVTSG